MTGCGDGVLDAGEECDDGNATDGDGCAFDCSSELIPGSLPGFGTHDCFQEFLAPPVRALDRYGRPSQNVRCTDGDAACDHGPAGDGACTFQVAFCFNVVDVRRTEPTGCTPTNVERMQLRTRVRFGPGQGTVGPDNQSALETALEGLGAVTRGECVDHSVGPRTLCTSNDDCSTPPGICDGRLFAFMPPLVGECCTEPADVVVPLSMNTSGPRTGKTWIRTRTRPTDDSIPGEPLAGDSDVLRLFCDPAP